MKITDVLFVFWFMTILAIVPICPLRSLSFTSTFTVNIPLAFFFFTWISASSPLLSDLPLDNTLSMCRFAKLLGYWSTASKVYTGPLSCWRCLLLFSSTGAFSAQICKACDGQFGSVGLTDLDWIIAISSSVCDAVLNLLQSLVNA